MSEQKVMSKASRLFDFVMPPSSRSATGVSIYGDAILLCATLLTIIGLVMVYAASAMKGAQQFSDTFIFIKKQMAVALVGFFLMAILQKISEKTLRLIAMPLFILGSFLLVLILIPGVYSSGGGASRWINIAGLRFQSSEIAKLGIIFFMAKSLSRPDISINDVKRGLLPNLLVLGFTSAFLMLQPDFGSTVLVNLVMFCLFALAGLRSKFILWSIAGGLMAAIGAVIAAPYRMARLTSFLDPWAQIKGGGFQIIQSYLAFHNGGLFGVGLGESKQKLYFLPEAHTDFILAVVGEELGFMGVSLVVALFSFFVFCGLRIAQSQRNHYRMFLAFGLTLLIGLQAAINMGVSMGLLPTKGIPLPFISSGASSLLASLVATGIIVRLARST